jgi:hypothetical protein
MQTYITNPLVDEINTLGNSLKALNIENIANSIRQKLEQWRMNYHEKIDHFFNKNVKNLID